MIRSDEKQSDNEKSTEVEKPTDDDKPELNKPKGLVGLFPLDLASELRKRVGGSAKFALRPSSSNIDILGKGKLTSREDVKLPPDNADEGQENLSFKDKLKLIERSSSKILVNPS